MGEVRLVATEHDVYVRGRHVGHVTDCGDCFRVGLRGRLRRRGFDLPDYDTMKDAVQGIVSAVTWPRGTRRKHTPHNPNACPICKPARCHRAR